MVMSGIYLNNGCMGHIVCQNFYNINCINIILWKTSA